MEGASSCSNCGSRRRARDPATLETHCPDCGLVLQGPEIVNPIPNSDDGTVPGSGRGVGPLVRAQQSKQSLGTSVGGVRDAHGKSLGQDTASHYKHLGWMMRREIERGKMAKNNNAEAVSTIARVISTLELPAIIRDEAEKVFFEGVAGGYFRGRSLQASTGAAVYAACRKYRQPQTLVEIANALSVKRWDVGRAFKALNRGLNQKVPTASLKTYLHRYAEELALTPQVRSTVEEMLDVASKRPEFSGVSPHGMVAAIIYLASEQHGEKRTRSEMAKVGSITEMTLRTTTKALEKLMSESKGSQTH